MAATENNENAVTKRNEEYKSPGRLKAEEKAERIRLAEEYRRKLEAENAALPAKKTKAAEQKEQEKLAKAEQELAERKAMVDEETQRASQHVAEAEARIKALMEKIESTEAQLAPLADTAAASEPTVYENKAPAASDMEKIVINIPISSVTVPCTVKITKTEAPSACAAATMMPMCHFVDPKMRVGGYYERKLKEIRANAANGSSVDFAEIPTASKASGAASSKTDFTEKKDFFSFERNGIGRPAITYGAGASADAAELEIEVAEADDAAPAVEETDLISELSTAAENADISAVEAEKIAEDIENAVD